MPPKIPDAVFRFFASDPAGPMLTFDREVSDRHDVLREPLEAFLASFGADDVEAAQSDGNFHFFSGHREDQDRAASVWLGERLLASEIARRRLETIREDRHAERPRPYELPALEDLPVCDDHLVPLSAFSFDARDSTHWLLGAIYEQGLADRTKVRLDPFLCGPAATYPAMFYRMWMYGRPLDWARVHALQEAEHGRWMPDSALSRGQFTDYAWVPRDEEVHFVCEEVPEREVVPTEAARYMHAVYSRRSRNIQHFDGALRVYEISDIHHRSALHARNAGKMGTREKVFLVDGPHNPDTLGQVAQAFFVWNIDVHKYFSDTFTVQETA